MKIVFDPRYEDKYCTNPVENPDRVRLSALELHQAGYEFIEPQTAKDEDIYQVHGREHINRVKARGLFDAAALSAGGAICAAELAMQGEPAFALVRPPGHHASANRSWGLCFFNNMAVAIKKIKPKAKRALIIDIDLHFGDGTVSIFTGDQDVKIVNPWSVDENFEYLNMNESRYLQQIQNAFQESDYDIIGISAGFDTYVEDWGKLLKLEDYECIGRAIKEGSKRCDWKRFAVLEGGYHPNLKNCIKRFIKGFK